ncbi:thioredoxin domain-containing protein [Skermania piniformis]|uniref:Thioredoxin domain-containing protein n=1 Tax=Skermania pinensis TaxID=39122 RepID=A0ABX8S5J5_9ACTN|nr:thioredoxin domain-containing protein [Skermania piniformis]QXQ13018.1 thioredoxin domain-containing protein [Skermania piniformis]
MTNRLAGALSPYLRQHADNPVHWQPWDDAAFAEARRRDVPVLLSVGYAACHWCHVMAHESFADPATAAAMNAHFVCIKVDREERPDVDAVYMDATVAMTGQGGWPMTCFLTPTGAPFYAGTYYPRIARAGMPAFGQVLSAIAETWQTRRDEVDRAAAAAVGSLRSRSTALPAQAPLLGPDLLNHAVATTLADEDREHGGFGGAPKFPPSALMEGLLRTYERTRDPAALAAVTRVATGMARGGIYDQLGGGFARYSVDDRWVVPHFEKMLYDNALLLRAYAHLARRTDDRLARRVAGEVARFLLDDLSTGTGGFASALDADTDGVEGATYLWTPASLAAELGSTEGTWAAQLFGVTDSGTFEAGASVLQLPVDPLDEARYRRVRAALRTARDRRPQPARDDKVIAEWNGLAITALAEAGAALDEPEWVAAAVAGARYLLDVHLVDGRLRRASIDGAVGSAPGVLADYASMVVGLAGLHQATGELEWLDAAQDLLDVATTCFAAADEPGAWFDSADDADILIVRPRNPIDGATPAGVSLLVEALQTVAGLSGPERAVRYTELAAETWARAAVVLARAPRSAGHWLAVSEAAVRPWQVAVSGADPELLAVARRLAPGGALIVGAEPNAVPLLVDRPRQADRSAAYVCRGTVCDRPVTTPEELAALFR